MSLNYIKENLKKNKLTSFVLLTWLLFFLTDEIFDIRPLLSGKGISIINNEFYRYLSAGFLHNGSIHLVFNLISMFFIGLFLERHIQRIPFLIFLLSSTTLTYFLFSIFYKQSTSVGGSTIIFASLGFIVLTQILDVFPNLFKSDSYYGQWLIGYSILGNFPVLYGNRSLFVIHLIAFMIGVILTYIIVKVNKDIIIKS